MRVKGWVTKCLAIMVVLAVFMTLAGPAMAKGSRRVLIGFKTNSVHKNAEQRGKFVKDRGGKVHNSFTLISAVSAELPEQAIANMKGHKEIAYVEDDIIMQAIAQSRPWGISRVNAPTAWGNGVRGAGVDVAILDTGIDYDHPDLVASLARGGGVNFEGFSNDGKTSASYWNDANGHGTHCAGIVAAENNGTGVVGVAPDVDLWAVKVLNSGGSGYTSDIIQGVQWCASNGIEVASMSLGGRYNQSLENACNAAYAAGVLIVAAAGNDYGGAVIYPAAYGSVIAVSATNSSDGLAGFSSVGPQVELAAPGASIYSTYKGGGYTTMSGTSMACPHVSGVVALVFADGGSSALAVRQTMNNTAMYMAGLSSDQQGYGLVDAGNAVDGTASPSLPVADFAGSPTSGEVSLTVGFTDSSSGSITSWSWDFGDDTTSDQQHPSHAYHSNGKYTVKLTVTNSAGSNAHTRIDYVTVTSPSPPSAYFSSSPGDQEPLAIDFTDGSTGDIDSWLWDFGDYMESAQSNPSHTYESVGTYRVSLTVTGPGGSHTYTDDITVTAPEAPIADFIGTPVFGSAPLTVSFTNLSTGDVTSWLWDFGDYTSSSLQNPSHTYQSAGSYTVSLKATGLGGSSTWTENNYITVNPAEELSLDVVYVDLKATYRGSKKWRVTATVLIQDSRGNPVSGASVSGAWSGVYSGSASGSTDANGKAIFRTGWMRKRGSVTFAVSKASKSGYTSAANSGSSDTITYGQ